MRQSIIQSLSQSKNNKVLVQHLEKAIWHWDAECLTITLQNSQVQQKLKEQNSTLLRFFQKELGEHYPIVKLSLESTKKREPEPEPSKAAAAAPKEQKAPPPTSTPQTPVTEEPKTVPLSQGQGQAAAQETQELRQAQTGPNSQEPPKAQVPQASLQQSQDQAPAPKAPDSKITPDKTKLQNSAPSTSKTKAVQARIIKREDYSTLPPEIQLLQRTFGAEVKEIPQHPEDSN